MREKILALMEKAIPGVDFNVSNTLVDDGILDSLGIINILAEISMEFGILIPFEELESSDLNSVDSITELVKKCMR